MPPTRVLLAATVCVLALLGAPTVAAQEDSPSDDISIEATDDSVATIEDGEIKISVNVVPHAKSSVDEAFRIRSTGTVEQRVSVSSDIDGVEFHRSDTGEPVEQVTLDPGESIGVGLTVDSSKDLDGDFFTIQVETEDDDPPSTTPVTASESSSISVTDVAVDPRQILAGESSTVTATVENDGDSSGSTMLGLEVDGTTVSQQNVTLESGEQQNVTFERTFQQVGEYEITVTNQSGETVYRTDAGTVSVAAPPSGAVLEVTNASVSSSDATPSDSVAVTATAVNTGDQAGTFTVELAVGGVVVDTQTISVPPGSSVELSFTHTFTETGTYAVSIAGVDAGSVSVGESTLESIVDRSLQTSTATALGPFVLGGALLFAWLRPRISRY